MTISATSQRAQNEPLSAKPAAAGTLRRSILRTVVYYDCFDFPLCDEEIAQLIECRASPAAVRTELESLIGPTLDSHPGPDNTRFTGLLTDGSRPTNRLEKLILRRCEGEQGALAIWPRVERRARLISRFPFVRAVAVSGSLSKGVHHPDDDVDFFVVTRSQRVYVARLLLMLFKRIALFGSHRLFCVNYLVAEDTLEVPDRNLFTATEIAWLIPMSGHDLMEDFVRANRWTAELLPNCNTPIQRRLDVNAPRGSQQGRGPIQRAVEFLLRGRIGDWLDRTTRRLIAARNRRRHGNRLSPEAYEQALRTRDEVSKHHPRNQQERILERFERQWQRCERQWQRFEASRAVQSR